jgi:peptidoglycan/xylan/chitin deacetylase (PgdA/CDA1 family)
VPAEVVLNGPRSSNMVALTFDADLSDWALTRVRDGRYPAQVNTEVLQVLESTQTPATIFVTGLWAEEYPAAMRRIAGNPRLELANHTFNHDAWTQDCYGLPTVDGQAAKTREVTRTAEIIRSYSGTLPDFFRFPGLCHTQQDVDLVAALGETPVDVDVETSDAFAEDADRTTAGILAEVQPGSIVLFHLNGAPNAPATAQIVRDLIPALTARGLRPVTLTELLRVP